MGRECLAVHGSHGTAVGDAGWSPGDQGLLLVYLHTGWGSALMQVETKIKTRRSATRHRRSRRGLTSSSYLQRQPAGLTKSQIAWELNSCLR